MFHAVFRAHLRQSREQAAAAANDAVYTFHQQPLLVTRGLRSWWNIPHDIASHGLGGVGGGKLYLSF